MFTRSLETAAYFTDKISSTVQTRRLVGGCLWENGTLEYLHTYASGINNLTHNRGKYYLLDKGTCWLIECLWTRRIPLDGDVRVDLLGKLSVSYACMTEKDVQPFVIYVDTAIK